MKHKYATKHVHVRKDEGFAVIKPHGNLMGGDETDEIEKLIEEFNSEGLPCLVINLADVGMMNSLAIGRLIAGHKMFDKRGARMTLCNLDKRIENVFVITKLALEFNVYRTEEAAIAGCSEDT